MFRPFLFHLLEKNIWWVVLSPPLCPRLCLVFAGPGLGAGVRRLAHSLFLSLASVGGGKFGGWPHSQGLGEVRSVRLLSPWQGVLIWCLSREGEHTEVWFATGFWFCGGFFVCFWFFVCFSPLVSLGQLVSVVIIFGFLFCWFPFFFFFFFWLVSFFGLSPLSLLLRGPSAPPLLASSPSSRRGTEVGTEG